MFAVIETGGKQYLVSPNITLKIEKIAAEEGNTFVFDKILLVADDTQVILGKPYLKEATVEAVVTKQGRARKIRMLRYHSKTRRRRRKGHRQLFTEVKITAIKK